MLRKQQWKLCNLCDKWLPKLQRLWQDLNQQCFVNIFHKDCAGLVNTGLGEGTKASQSRWYIHKQHSGLRWFVSWLSYLRLFSSLYSAQTYVETRSISYIKILSKHRFRNIYWQCNVKITLYNFPKFYLVTCLSDIFI